jgi:hypothetical protein
VQHEVDHTFGVCRVGEFRELSKTNPEIIELDKQEAIRLYKDRDGTTKESINETKGCACGDKCKDGCSCSCDKNE